MFVIRNVANLVPPYSPDGRAHGVSAALEYALKVLHVENIVVLGHSHCGGIESFMNDTCNAFEFMGPWMASVKEAKEQTLKFILLT